MRTPLVMIDPGHGGDAPGRVVGDIHESDLNLSISRLLFDELYRRDVGANVTRSTDQSLSLKHRCEMEAAMRYDCFVSIHCNGFRLSSAHGFEVFTSPGQTAADPLATKVIEAVGKAFPNQRQRLGLADGDPDKEEKFHVLTGTRCPAILVECGFMTNPDELQFLLDFRNQQRMACAIADGILEWWRER